MVPPGLPELECLPKRICSLDLRCERPVDQRHQLHIHGVRDQRGRLVAASTASAVVTPRAVPGAPTGVTATAEDAAGLVSWTAPVSHGGSAITRYTITSCPGGKTAWVSWLATTGTVTGLSNGTAYTFPVSASNAVGTSTGLGRLGFGDSDGPDGGVHWYGSDRVLNTLAGGSALPRRSWVRGGP
jgi:hypothetical protein